MRQAAVADIWSDLNKKSKFPLCLKSLKFEDVENIKTGTLDFSYGVSAICGANGVGKSTILECINYLLSAGELQEKKDIFLSSKLKLNLVYKGEERECNSETIQDVEEWFDIESEIKYIKTGSSVNCMLRFKSEKNIEDYLDSTEEELFSKKDLENISQIIGKRYEGCKAYMIEETSLYESDPFFIVKSKGIEYDTRNMGVGEHSVIYLYYYLKNMKSSIILLEEPENFIPPYSQKNFIHTISRLCVDNKLNMILTTHSNYILEEIPEEHILLLRKNPINDKLIINKVYNQEYLKPLGLEYKTKGYLLVEDIVAKYFCMSIIKILNPQLYNRYRIISVKGGCTEIAKILKCYKSEEYQFEIMGIFDGDMNTNDKQSELEVTKFNWKYIYLPYDKDAEEIFKLILYSPKGIHICNLLYKNEDDFLKALSDTQMYEKHDWIHAFSNSINVTLEHLIDIIVKYLIEIDGKTYNTFIDALVKSLELYNV
ncbi:ATP-dependent endonuclease [Clostridium sp.]|uniref:ATP-dependent nuclease n=1 Tax=Clostridium sp. TaxID=1506 RepID=UPI001DCD4F8E|nr:ATP-binding protein [Clostridium sp.]MBS5936808.1 AAA family ATPase [Clostridium sp.]